MVTVSVASPGNRVLISVAVAVETVASGMLYNSLVLKDLV